MENETKSFWSRKEGKVGMFFIGLLIAAGSVGIFKNLAEVSEYLVKLSGNMFLLGINMVGLFLLASIVLNKNFQTLVKYLFQAVMWQLTNFFVDLNPIAILKGYMAELKDQLRNIDEKMSVLKGHIVNMSNLMEKNAHSAEEALQLAAAARKKGDLDRFNISSRNVERYKKSIDMYQQTKTKLENAYNILLRIRKFTNSKYEDMDAEVKVTIERSNAFKAVGSAISSAYAIIKGGQGRSLYDAAMEKLANDYAQDVGKLQDFMASTEDLLKTMDLQDEVAAQKAMAMIDQWEAKSQVFDGEIVDEPKALASSYSSVIEPSYTQIPKSVINK